MTEKVGVVGAGPVGLVAAAVLASWGHQTTIVERDLDRLEQVTHGRAPFFEPGLDIVLTEVRASGRLAVSSSVLALDDADVVFVCVGTPPSQDGRPDLRDLEGAVQELVPVVKTGTVLVVKSTVPPGTTEQLASRANKERNDLAFVSCPEFLQEGRAVEDMLSPDRIVIGGVDRISCQRVAALFTRSGAPVVYTNPASAELIKYGSNAFLATKISFINELAQLCELVGGDVVEVADGIGSDPRIGRAFLNAGLGFGGSCFPKDVRALEATAAAHGHTSWLLKACTEINNQQRVRFAAKVKSALGGSLIGKHISVLGLAFKPGTDDLRQAPALDVIRSLEEMGASVVATDPVAIEKAKSTLPNTKMTTDVYSCVAGANAVVIATEWPEYKSLDWSRIHERMDGNVIVDGRNFLDRQTMTKIGFEIHGIGRSPSSPSTSTQSNGAVGTLP